MLGAAARGRANSATKNAAIIPGTSHRRHWAASARPGGPGEDVRIVVLLLRARRHAGQDLADLMAGLARPEADRPGRDHPGRLYSGARRAAGRFCPATLVAWIRACHAPSTTSSTSRMITDSTLSAAMPSGQRQFPTSP